MATKRTKKESKPAPVGRIFFGGQLYHECSYDSGKATAVYHDDTMTDRFEKTLTERLTDAARIIVSENPDTGLLKI